jgi:hypothetical protein
MSEKKILSPSDLTINKQHVLGSGGAGNVYKGSLKGPNGRRAVAVKVLETTSSATDPPQEYVLLEKALLGCPFVCHPLGYCRKDGETCMVLHLYEKSLSKYINERAGAQTSLDALVPNLPLFCGVMGPGVALDAGAGLGSTRTDCASHAPAVQTSTHVQEKRHPYERWWKWQNRSQRRCDRCTASPG